MVWVSLGRIWPGLLVLLIGLPALAAIDRTLFAGGWSEVTFEGKTPNMFATLDDGGIAVSSDRSVSLLEMPLTVDLGKTPVLSWRWRVTSQAPPTDLSVKGGDDRSLVLYVAFPFVPEEATAMERMRRAIVETIVGEDAPGRVLMYVWGGEGRRGDRVQSPHLGSSGMMTILRPANTEPDAWFEETVDIAEDYRQIFGAEPPDPLSIAIGADTDDTATMAMGVVTGLDFIAKADAS